MRLDLVYSLGSETSHQIVVGDQDPKSSIKDHE